MPLPCFTLVSGVGLCGAGRGEGGRGNSYGLTCLSDFDSFFFVLCFWEGDDFCSVHSFVHCRDV